MAGSTSLRPLFCLVFAAFTSLGCGDLDGLGPALDKNLTPEPTIHIEARADGSGTTVIRACTATSGLLCDGKTGSTGGLRASSGGESVEFSFEPLYTAADGSEMGSYRVELKGDEEGKAIAVTWDTSNLFEVTLPAPIAVTAPAEGAVIAKGDASISVSYAPSGQPEKVAWTLAVQCPETSFSAEGALTTDTGEILLDAEALKGELDAGGCPAALEVKRAREGTSESAREGSILGIQARSRTFTLAP